MLVDVYYWCIDVLVGVLSRHVGWRLLTYALTSWLCAESTCWLTFTDALTYCFVCWIDMLVDIYWCIDVLVGVLDRHANVCTVLLNAIVADRLLHLVIKRSKKKKLHIYYIFKAGWKPSFSCSCKVKCKTQHHLNRGRMQDITVKQGL